ncbi:MAG: hypothetical protein COA79_24570 [Planctomycetota bacterium]|nr:MAG: hypothetical protein COA79_24570 [Planctomycetota bacterium]
MKSESQIQKLIVEAKTGSNEALGHIVDEFQSSVRGFIAMLGVSPDMIIDLSQETFLMAFKSIEKFNDENPFGPWIRGIARNLVYQYYAVEKKQSLFKRTAIEKHLLEKEPVEESINQLTKFRQEYLNTCLSELPEKSAELIRQKYQQGKNSVQMGDALKIKPNSIRKSIARIHQKLKICIESKQALENN